MRRTRRMQGTAARLLALALISASLVVGAVGATSSPASAAVVPVPSVVTLAGGGTHMCAVTAAHGVRCWGQNYAGQVGNGTTTSQVSQPAAVTGLSSGVAAVGAGISHSCAVTAVGGVRCWGSNSSGQLGDGTVTDSNVPVAVSGLPAGVIGVTGGTSHTCALTSSGSVWCWGSNGSGRLGDGTTISSNTPVQVVGLSDAVAVDAGSSATCALRASGAVVCWGSGASGNLGTGTTASASTPQAVVGLDGHTVSLALGAGQACAVSVSGDLKCWGSNSQGGAGAPAGTSSVLTPTTPVGLGADAVQVTAAINSTCALRSGGQVTCWGYGGGAQGDGTASNGSLPPTDAIDPPDGIVTLATTTGNTCGLLANGSIQCWGEGASAGGHVIALGLGTPVPAYGVTSGATAVDAGIAHTCAVISGGAWCWGSNTSGALGRGDADLVSASIPAPVVDLSAGVTAVAAGDSFSCAIKSGGVWCWGENKDGILGTSGGTDSTTPVAVPGMQANVTAIAAGWRHVCAVQSGGVRCWGQGGSGQLGQGSTSSSIASVPVSGIFSGATAVSAGQFHSCAIVSGAVKCWGSGGQLGNGSSVDSTTPVQATGLTSGWSGIDSGQFTTCAVSTAGSVKCWGTANGSNGIGNGTTSTFVTSPAQVTGITSGATAVSVGTIHMCAVVSGAVKCWGDNDYSQLGNGITGDALSPVASGVTSGATAVGSGDHHSCAVVSGAISCWGQQTTGRLGNWIGAPAEVTGSLTFVVPPVNAVPVAGAPSISLDRGATTSFSLVGSDGDDDPLTYAVTSQPARGTLSCDTPAATCSYTAPASQTGTDSFTYTVTDGRSAPVSGTVSITVTEPPNAVPVAGAPSISLNRGATTSFSLVGSDGDDDPLTYAVTSQPARGTLSCDTPAATCSYTAPTSSSGGDSFTYTVTDGKSAPVSGTVSITVALPRLSIGDVQVLEAESGPAGVYFPITLSSPATSDVTISYYTSNGSAGDSGTPAPDGGDFQRTGSPANPAKVKIAAGQVWNTVGVTVFSDLVTEPDETFAIHIVAVSSADPVAVRDADAEATIIDTLQSSDDPLLSVQNADLWEGDQGTPRAQFPIRLSEPAPAPFTITYYTLAESGPGVATAGTDYRVLAPRTVTVAAGTRTVMIDTTVYGDVAVEADERFTLVVVPSNDAPVIQRDMSGIQIIRDDD